MPDPPGSRSTCSTPAPEELGSRRPAGDLSRPASLPFDHRGAEPNVSSGRARLEFRAMTAPADPRDRLVDRVVAVSNRDPRIVAVFEGGWRARGEADEHSDVDITVVVGDDALDDVR